MTECRRHWEDAGEGFLDHVTVEKGLATNTRLAMHHDLDHLRK